MTDGFTITDTSRDEKAGVWRVVVTDGDGKTETWRIRDAELEGRWLSEVVAEKLRQKADKGQSSAYAGWAYVSGAS